MAASGSLLPSQRQTPVFVGPFGSLVKQESHQEVKERSGYNKWRRVRAAAKIAEEDEEDEVTEDACDGTAANVINALKIASRNASHGVSSTRLTTSRLAESLAEAKLTAEQLAGPDLVEFLDEQMQIEILSCLSLEAAAAAMRVCSAWRDFFAIEETLWEKIVASASCQQHAAFAASRRLQQTTAGSSAMHAPASSPSFQSIGRHLQRCAAATSARWRSGTCTERCHRALHGDYVMAMCLHDGCLISASADQTLAVTRLSSSSDMGAAATADGSPFGGLGESSTGGAGCSSSNRHREDEWADGSAPSTAAGSSSSSHRAQQETPPSRSLLGHRGQVLCVHAHGEHAASCSSDGDVLIWSLRDAFIERRHRLGSVYSVNLHEQHALICGGEGRTPVRLFDWRTANLRCELPDEDAPAGVTTSLLRLQSTNSLAASNSDNHSQLRVWDLQGGGALADRFSLPAYCKGGRCLAAPSPHTLVMGCSNGWVVAVDLRNGRYERKFAHSECVNALATSSDGRYLVSAGDDKLIRITDLRKGGGYEALGTHRTRSTVFCCCADDEAIYAGMDFGDVRVFDYSAEANPATGGAQGGFTTQQKAALAAALANAQRQPGARLTPGRIRPAR